jgi:hypothetical protein
VENIHELLKFASEGEKSQEKTRKFQGFMGWNDDDGKWSVNERKKKKK